MRPPTDKYPDNFDSSLEVCLQGLLEDGAQLVIPQYSVATHNQVDIISNGRRLLLTPDDEAYKAYAHTLQRAGLPYLEADARLSTDSVIVGELPRDSRPVAHVIRSKPSSEGTTPDDIMGTFGRTIARIASEQHVVPSPSEFNLSRVLVRRVANDIMLLPPFSFVKADDNVGNEFVDKIQKDLWLNYSRYRAISLFHSFSEGLKQ